MVVEAQLEHVRVQLYVREGRTNLSHFSLLFIYSPDGLVVDITEPDLPRLHRGDIVTVAHVGFAHKSDVILQPKILRVRTDISWPEILERYTQDQPGASVTLFDCRLWVSENVIIVYIFLVDASRRVIGLSKDDTGWSTFSSEKSTDRGAPFACSLTFFSESLREFCEKFAKRQGFSPLVPSNWYSISSKQFAAAPV